MSDHATVADHSVTIVRTFGAPIESVWAAWTEPVRFARWFGTPPYHTPAERVAMDLRPGGVWRATQVGEDGTELPFAGRYRAVEPPTRLVFTFEDLENPSDAETETATVILRDLGDGTTEVEFSQEGFMPQEQYPLLAQGYGLFFDRMAAYLAE